MFVGWPNGELQKTLQNVRQGVITYHLMQSPFTKLWQSCSDPHLKIRPHRNFRHLFSKLQSHCTLARQLSPKAAHKNRDKEKITAIYCL